MSGKSVYVKPAGKTRHPLNLAAVVVATRPVAGESRHGRTPLVFDSACIASARFRRRRWESIGLETLTEGPAVLDRLEQWARPRGATWVVSPYASAALTLCGFLPRLIESGAIWSGAGSLPPEGDTRAGPGRPKASRAGVAGVTPGPESRSAADPYIVSAFVTSGKPDIIKYSRGGKTLTWISGKQFFDSTEESLAESVGFPWPRSGGPVPVGTVVLRDPADRAELWLRLFQELCDWWRQIDGGPFSATPGGMALNYVRRRIAPKTLLKCRDPEVNKLEEAGLFGGRASTWCYCPIASDGRAVEGHHSLSDGRPFPLLKADARHWDIAGMYPTILAREVFPVRFLHQWHNPAVADVAAMLGEWCVIASVRVKSERAEYPYRSKKGIIFPVGEYDTVLVGPELDRAVRDGDVIRVYRAATYRRGRPFGEAAGELLKHRQDARNAGRPAWELFVKLLSNSFGGKLAQRSHEWQRRRDVLPEVPWGEWFVSDRAAGTRRHFRSRAGLVDERVPLEQPTRPLAQCFDYLTSHGRYLMRLVRECLPLQSVVSQDTDGLWVLPTGQGHYERARALLASQGYRLRQEQLVTQGRWYGPRHYWTSEGWTLAGMADPRRWSDGLTFDDSYRKTPVSTASDLPPVWVYDCRRTVRLNEIPPDGTVGADGWAIPYRLR